MKNRKPLVLVLIAAAVLIAIPFGVIFWVESEPGQRYIERRASEATGREISIGDIDVKVGLRPGLRVSGLRVTNPDWAKTRHLVDTALIDARISLLPLLTGRVVVEDLTLVQAKIGAEREENRNTWTFKEQAKKDEGPSRFFVKRIDIDRGFVVYRDTTIKTDLEMDVTGNVGGGGGIDVIARGTVRGQKARAVANFPGLLPTPDTAVEMSAAVSLGELTAAAAGTIRAADVDGIDLDLDISGASLGDIKKLAPVNLPDTPPYRLQGRFRNPAGAFIFDPFEGRVGDSDLSGSAQYSKSAKRPVLKANLVSHLLDFDDLGPVVGAPPKTGPGETAAPKQKKQVQAIDSTGKVLPQKRIEVEDFPLMDADVRFEGKKILDAAHVPIEDLSAHWTLKDNVLRFEPLRFRMAHGQVTANISLDANQKPVLGKANLEMNGLDLRQLFPPTQTMKRPLGTLFGRVDITGRGTSAADLFGTADGRMAMMINGGYISNLLVEAAGLDVAEALRILATKDVDVKLRCAVVDLSIKQGVATPQALVIDTTDTIITATGKVDFRAEQVDILTKPVPKDPSPFVLRTPIIVQGAFKKPAVKPQIGPLLARGAAAIALGAINPVLAFIPFVETGPGKDSDCGQLLARVRAEGVKDKPSAAK
jgi:AsmA family protein